MSPSDEQRAMPCPSPTATRRGVLLGAGAIGALALVGCDGDGDGGYQSGSTATSAAPTPTQSSSAAAAAPLAKVADVPDGGALAVESGAVILTRKGDTVTALSSKCTHQGCTVAPQAKELACPCHGSRFDLTGAVLKGPATAPLAPMDVKVAGGQVFPA